MSGLGSIAIALNTQETSTGQWVHLIPAGRFSGRDGRGPWQLADPDGVITVTNRARGDALPVDYEHQTSATEKNGQPAPAAGWIKELQARGGELWGRVEWTARAAAHIAAKEYRFISPVFSYTPENGRITSLFNAALTNNPNLELTALARAEETNVDELAELQHLLGLTGSAELADVVVSVRSLVSEKAGNRPDPAKFVPIDVFEKLAAELNIRNQGMADELAERHVAEQITAGRMFPFLKDWGVALCRTNRPAFDAFVSKTSPGLQGLFAPSGINRLAPSKARLSDTETTIARKLGQTDDEFIAANRSASS